jgi:hypothetical protein
MDEMTVAQALAAPGQYITPGGIPFTGTCTQRQCAQTHQRLSAGNPVSMLRISLCPMPDTDGDSFNPVRVPMATLTYNEKIHKSNLALYKASAPSLSCPPFLLSFTQFCPD